MALNSTGPISFGGAAAGQSIDLELGRASNATISMNETAVRTLAGTASGAVPLSAFRGKSNGPVGPVPDYWFLTATMAPTGGYGWQGNATLVTGSSTIIAQAQGPTKANYVMYKLSNAGVASSATYTTSTTDGGNFPYVSILPACTQSGNTYFTMGLWDVAFINKHNNANNIVWSRRTPINSNTRFNTARVVADADENIYTVLPGDTASASYPVLLKYNTNGVFLWARKIDITTYYAGMLTFVCIDGSNNVFVSFATYAGGSSGRVICKFDGNGNQLWIKNLIMSPAGGTGPWSDGASAVHSSTGDTYHTGVVSLNSPMYTYQQNRLIVTKVSSTGNIVWSRYLGNWQTHNLSCGSFAASARSDGTLYVLYALTPNGAFGELRLSSFDSASGNMTASVMVTGLSYGGNPISMSHDGNGGIVIFGLYNPYSQQLWSIRIPDSLNTSGAFTAGAASAGLTSDIVGTIPMSPSPGNQNPYMDFAVGTITSSVSGDITTATSEFVSAPTTVTTTLAPNL